MMKKHKGEIIELATRNSGYSLKQVAKRLGVSRSTLYNRFQDIDLSDDFILKLSEVIHHDFSNDLPHLKTSDKYSEFKETPAIYQSMNQRELVALQKKYYELLETHGRLLKLCIKLVSIKEDELGALQKSLIGFVDKNLD